MKMSIHKKDKCPLCGELKDVRSKRCRRKHKTPEEICEKRKEWAKNNRERIRKAQQKYRETHREECRQRKGNGGCFNGGASNGTTDRRNKQV